MIMSHITFSGLSRAHFFSTTFLETAVYEQYHTLKSHINWGLGYRSSFFFGKMTSNLFKKILHLIIRGVFYLSSNTLARITSYFHDCLGTISEIQYDGVCSPRLKSVGCFVSSHGQKISPDQTVDKRCLCHVLSTDHD